MEIEKKVLKSRRKTSVRGPAVEPKEEKKLLGHYNTHKKHQQQERHKVRMFYDFSIHRFINIFWLASEGEITFFRLFDGRLVSCGSGSVYRRDFVYSWNLITRNIMSQRNRTHGE